MLVLARVLVRKLGMDKGGSYTQWPSSSGIGMGWEKRILPGERAPRTVSKD
jgi:hypothetical protein